jgi:branched-chain amino acid transport system permease protein
VSFHSLFSQFGDLTVDGLAEGSIFALFALGYTLVYGVLRLINFAHSEVFVMGTFFAILTWGWLGLGENSPTPSFWPMLGFLLAGFAVAMIASGVTALAVEFVAYRPLRRRNAPPLAFLITAIGASLVIQQAIGVRTQFVGRGAPVLISHHTLFKFLDGSVTNVDVLLLGLALVMMAVASAFINRTRTGKAIRAVAQNPDSAALMGINKNRIISYVFLTGGLMAGVAAVMFVIKIGGTRYDDGFGLGIQAFTAAVLGGIGNLRGALLGGLVLGLVENYGAGLFGSAWHDVVGFVILIVILMFRPTGLLGESLGRARA